MLATCESGISEVIGGAPAGAGSGIPGGPGGIPGGAPTGGGPAPGAAAGSFGFFAKRSFNAIFFYLLASIAF